MFRSHRRTAPEMKMGIEHYTTTASSFAAQPDITSTHWLKIVIPGSGISGGIGGGRSYDTASNTGAINRYTSDESLARIGNIIQPCRIQFRIVIAHPAANDYNQEWHCYLLWVEDVTRTFPSVAAVEYDDIYENLFDKFETDTISGGCPSQEDHYVRGISREKLRDGAFKVFKHWKIHTSNTTASAVAGTGEFTDGTGAIEAETVDDWSATGRNTTTKCFRYTFKPKHHIRYQSSAHISEVNVNFDDIFESMYALVVFPVITNGGSINNGSVQVVTRMWYWDT